MNTPAAKKVSQLFDRIHTGGEAMDWQKCMNQAMEYVENNLSETIDYSVTAQFMNCSE